MSDIQVTSEVFGAMPDGTPVQRFTISNGFGAKASFLNYGAIWQSLKVSCRTGTADVILGYDTLPEYLSGKMFFGETVGRVANRIRSSRFTLNGKEYRVDPNEGENCCHSGCACFGKRVWKAEADEETVTFSLISPDGDGGFPGNFSAEVTFGLRQDGALSIRYLAVCDQDTICNLTNHAYFNLRGQGSGTVSDTELRICADRITEVGPGLLPTGQVLPVEGTPLDFRAAKPIGRDLDEAGTNGRLCGYDHNFVLNRSLDGAELCAEAHDPVSGIRMTVYTDQPGVQLYVPASLGGERGKNGAVYGDRPSFCLETQHWPDAMSQPDFPSIVLHAGELFTSQTIYRFTSD